MPGLVAQCNGMPTVDVRIAERDAMHNRHLGGALVALVLLLARPNRGCSLAPSGPPVAILWHIA